MVVVDQGAPDVEQCGRVFNSDMSQVPLSHLNRDRRIPFCKPHKLSSR
jgi:hypothetical protein